MKLKNRTILLFAVYMALITVLTLVYDYPETLMKRPQSVHNWRQCDGASLALNYYQEGMHFFRPQTHMLYSDNYTTGYSAPSEIPVLYYFVAILYKVFGYHEFIFRAVNLLIFYIGLFYLFRLADTVLRDVFYTAVVTVLIFSAPVLVYYANNFMPNTVALSFSFIGWYYFYRYYLDKKTGFFLLSALFFFLASAMKITELTGPIIILALITAERLKLIRIIPGADNKFLLKSGLLIFIMAVTAGWVYYAKFYNGLHQSAQFSTFAHPIWGMDKDAIDFTIHKMKVIWFRDYFYQATFWLMCGTLLMTLIFWKRSDKVLRLVCLFETLAVLTFSVMWFNALGDHDYFFIGFYVLPAFLFINFFLIIKSAGFNKVNTQIIRLVFLAVTIINVYYAHDRHSLRYYGSWMNDYEQQKDLYTISPWLKESGFTKNDTVIFYPSGYIRPLYLMNVKGWTVFRHETTDSNIVQRDSSLMSKFVRNGAEYFITNDIKSAVAYKPLQPYLKDLYAKYNRVFIFRLPPERQNFNPSDTLMMNY